MKLFQINKSQKSMYMNERAYSGEPINTIGFHMYFPHMMGEELKEAVNQVIQMDDIFRTIMIENNYEVKFYLQDKPVHLCQLEDRLTREEAEQKAKELEQLPFSGLFEGKLYKAIVWPIREGGALLAFCFHHIIIDGYGMYHTAQRILDILNKKEICYLFSYTGQELECDKKKTEENRTFWKKIWEVFIIIEQYLRRHRRDSAEPVTPIQCRRI